MGSCYCLLSLLCMNDTFSLHVVIFLLKNVHFKLYARRSQFSTVAEWKAIFVFPLQSTTSKTSKTQQWSLCPIYQVAGEFHTSVHLKVGGLERMEEAEPREQQKHAWSPGPSAMAAEPTTPENLAVAGDVVHMTQASWPHGYYSHK